MVDTNAIDSVSKDTCSSQGPRAFPSPAWVKFSVGDIVDLENYTLSQSGVSVIWSGDCSGTGNSCIVIGSCTFTNCPAHGVLHVTATVKYGSLEAQFNIVAIDGTYSQGGGALPND